MSATEPCTPFLRHVIGHLDGRREAYKAKISARIDKLNGTIERLNNEAETLRRSVEILRRNATRVKGSLALERIDAEAQILQALRRYAEPWEQRSITRSIDALYAGEVVPDCRPLSLLKRELEVAQRERKQQKETKC